MSKKVIKQPRLTVDNYAKDKEKLNKILFDIDKRLGQLERICTRILTTPKKNDTVIDDIIEAAKKDGKPNEDNASEPKEEIADTL